MTKKVNLKSLHHEFQKRYSKRPKLRDVARAASISHPHLTNIINGRRKASPVLESRIKSAFERVMI